MRVLMVERFDEDGNVSFSPDLPAGVSFSILAWHDDGTVTVNADDSFFQPARDLATKLVIADKVKADDLDDDTMAQLTPLFDPWRVGISVKPGEVYSWDGTLVEVLQEHTTQADWTPDTAASLWKMHRKAGAVTPWVQPQGAHDEYSAGDKVTHEGTTWVSDIDNNVWVPGVYGWSEA